MLNKLCYPTPVSFCLYIVYLRHSKLRYITVIKHGNRTAYPCFICDIPRDKLLEGGTYKEQKVSEIATQVRNVLKGNRIQELEASEGRTEYSVPTVKPFQKLLPFSVKNDHMSL